METDARRHRLFDELAVVGKAFGSPKRLELVELLAQGERTVDALARAAGMGVSTVSAHLQVLKLANLVRTRRDGTKVFYRLAGDDVADLYAAMRDVARTRSADVSQALEAYLNLPGSDEVGLVSRDELTHMLEAGDVTLLDVRPPEEYLAGHIPGSRNTPLGTLEAEVESLREAPSVVAYCRGSFCVMAHDAVRILGGAGVEARRLEDGMLEWRTSGLPVEAGAA
ncbi:transcriptional regulator [Nocardioides flavus (ex Wang et al. 2016)]|uniref:Transcriptional regulator n=1 Tax=Nocardioides flavus (ex Wang et al. 2016) TaxID=2058780 RepID=A0ABQ3HL30_9ACTN|nr:metalloregulator ArsR/SmtB family transcription factor [Nocardioides flavus (ex Wang et al. 2016)]GHE17364.1 transcriptional regulator [Nocardioides flavus (ex Wang et al. 2016)]